jgi:hypothetical protein
VRLAPDNTLIACASSTGIWALDLQRKTKTRITFDRRICQESTWSMTQLPLVLAPTYLVPTFLILHLTALFQARRLGR